MNLFKLFGEIAIKNDDAKKGIDETTDKAKDAEKDVSAAFSGMGNAAVKVGKTIVKGLAVGAAAIGALVAAAESSREYRTEMGKLDTAFESSGHSAETAKATYKELQSVLGETDQAVEAANHLAKLCETEEDLAAWTEICTGVYGTFGASLPIEGLTEAANETARCGQLTGPLTDAINWAAKAGETFGVTLKENTEVNKEWNTAVENAASAEDFFNLALQECTTEQERQQLIMKTLNGLYGDAAKKYKATNDELIKANKTTERMNELWAKVGDKVQPIVTTFKEGIIDLGEALLGMVSDADIEEFNDALASGFEFLAEDVIPVLIDGLTWVFEHIELIASIAVGAATAFLTYKAAVVVATVAQAGMTAAVGATTAAQATLNTAMSATPWGLIISLIGGAVAALITFVATTDSASGSTTAFTEEEKKLIDEAKKAADALREQKEAADDASDGIMAQKDYVTDLSDELMSLADSSGYVEEKDRSRVEFILNELNEALGTEYKLVDGVIQQYGELQENIDGLIKSKTALALIDAHSEAYTKAIEAERAARERLTTAANAYKTVLQELHNLTGEHAEEYKRTLEEQGIDAEQYYRDRQNEIVTLMGEYNAAKVDYGKISEEITKYQEAQTAATEENYDKVIEIYAGAGESALEYADTVDEATRRSVDALYNEMEQAGFAYAEKLANIDKYGADAVAEAKEMYEQTCAAFVTAYDDAMGVGEDIASGVVDGMAKSGADIASELTQTLDFILTEGQSYVNRNPIKLVVKKPGWDGQWDGGGSVAENYYISGSHADGLDYVPFDGYVAELHKGEMVLPAESAEFVRAGGNNQTIAKLLGGILNVLTSIEDSNSLGSETSLVFNKREFGRLVRGVL